MFSQQRQRAPCELEDAIEHNIIQRTWGQVISLQVEVTAERVIIQGWTTTFHQKQVALAAVREITCLPVDLNIQVLTQDKPVPSLPR